MADFYEDKQLTMKQFLVVLAMGYVLDAIPDLLEVSRCDSAESRMKSDLIRGGKGWEGKAGGISDHERER